MELEQVLRKAINYAIAHHPDSSQQHRAAFANSVGYFVTGWSGGYGGPSIREHLCSHALVGDGENLLRNTRFGKITISFPDGRLPRAGEWEFDRAIAFCEPICFGQLSRHAIKIVVTEHCFDDDPSDLEQIRLWEIEELKELSLLRKSGKLPQQQWERLKFLEEKHA